MSLENKASESERLAYQLKSCNEYNLAANRFYYSAYQKFLHLGEREFDYKYEGKANSHLNLLEYMADEIQKYLLNPNYLDEVPSFVDIINNIDTLKKYRVKADYKPWNVNKGDLDKVVLNYKEFCEKYDDLKNF